MKRRILAIVMAAFALVLFNVVPSSAAPAQSDVVGMKYLGAGVYEYSIISPTPTATKAQVTGWLHRQGYQTSGVSTRVGCSPHVGTANALCNAKWSYGGFNDPQVYYIDYSGDAWPVTDARVDWYQAPGIDAYYRWHTAGCPGGGRHCVSVRSGRYGNTHWYGRTTYRTTASGYFIDGSVRIQLNDSLTPSGYGKHRSVACHEMGHALGLDHNTGSTSCIRTYVAPAFPQHPTSNDFSVLNRLYPKPGT